MKSSPSPYPPPQDKLVCARFISGTDGREAVAAEDISMGSLVLAAAPFVMAPFTSATSCAMAAAAKATSTSANKQSSTTTTTTSSSSCSSVASSVHSKTHKRLRHMSWCAGCMQPIEVGTWVVNHDQLMATAENISVEHALLRRQLEEAAGAAAAAAAGEGGELEEDRPDTAGKANHKKKPNSKNKKKGKAATEAAALKQRIEENDRALFLEQYKQGQMSREVQPGMEAGAFWPGRPATISIWDDDDDDEEEEDDLHHHHHHLHIKEDTIHHEDDSHHLLNYQEADAEATFAAHRADEVDDGDEDDRDSQTQTGDGEDNHNLTSYKKPKQAKKKMEWTKMTRRLRRAAAAAAEEEEAGGGCAGCEHCGVPLLCSRHCWTLYRTHHQQSGECVTLRRIWFPMMKHYFTQKGNGGGSLPAFGSEPSIWSSRCQADRELEMHALLLAALGAAAVVRAGFKDRLTEKEVVHLELAPGEHSATDSDHNTTTTGTTRSQTAAAEATTLSSPVNEIKEAEQDDSEEHHNNYANSHGSEVDRILAHPNPALRLPVGCSVLPKAVTNLEGLRQLSESGAVGVEVLDQLNGVAGAVDESREGGAMLSAIGSEPLHTVWWEGEREEESAVVGTPTAATAPAVPTSAGGARGRSSSSSTSRGHRHRHYQQVRQPSYTSAARLVTNLSVLPRDRHTLYRSYWHRYSQLLAPLLATLPLTSEQQEDAVGFGMSESFFHRIGAACQSNSFGVYSSGDDCLGSGLYPEASLFNHSCAPNLCRVMRPGRTAAFYALRDIPRGEPLTICYIELCEDSTAERRRTLMDAYRFFCGCSRCSGGRQGYPLYLCGKCVVKGYLRPLLPSCEQGECTVCRLCSPFHSDVTVEVLNL